jgi:hypothetical protein
MQASRCFTLDEGTSSAEELLVRHPVTIHHPTRHDADRRIIQFRAGRGPIVGGVHRTHFG